MDINWIIDSPFNALPVGDKDKTALMLNGEDSLTYEELRERRDKFIHILRANEVEAGDRVGMLLLNDLDYVALYFAIGRIGAIAVRLNSRLVAEELEYIINDAGCRVVFFHSSRTAQLNPVHERLGVNDWICLEDDDTGVPSWAQAPIFDHGPLNFENIPRPASSDPLMLMYTSGTTGRPKGAVWTHENSMWCAVSQALSMNITDKNVVLTAGPLFHVGAFECLVMPALLMHGTATILTSGGMSVERLVGAIRGAQATDALIFPFMLYELLRLESLNPEDLASLRRVVLGGDLVVPEAIKTMQKRFPQIQMLQAYGLTEGGSIVSLISDEASLKYPDSVGRPLPLIEIKTVRDDGTDANSDEIGEVWVRSGAASQKYWNAPEQSERTFVGGWCRSGDLGRISEDGYLFITGRLKDMIRSGGENIYPAELEGVLGAHPDVGSMAIVAVADPKLLEVGCAVVKPVSSDVDVERLEQDLRDLAAEKLAAYKRPRHYRFVEDFPATASGKIRKVKLREKFAGIGQSPNTDSFKV